MPMKEMYPSSGMKTGRQGLNLTKKVKVRPEGQNKICNAYAQSEGNIF